MPILRSGISRPALFIAACLAFLPLLTACTSEPTVRHFTFDGVQDETATHVYTVGSRAMGTATETPGAPMAGEYVVSIQLTAAGADATTVHPNVTVYFENSTVHCYARGASPHDPVRITDGTTSTKLICEEPFPDPMEFLGITVTDGG